MSIGGTAHAGRQVGPGLSIEGELVLRATNDPMAFRPPDRMPTTTAAAALGASGDGSQAASTSDALMRGLLDNEVTAYRSFFDVAAEIHGRESFGVVDTGEAYALMSNAVRRPGVFNRILGLGLRAPLRPEAVGAALGCFHGGGVAVEMKSHLVTPDVAAMLRGMRLRRWGRSAVAVLQERLHSVDAGPVRVLRIEPTDTARARLVAELCGEVFGVSQTIRDVLAALPRRDGWRSWLALDGGVPLGAALSHIADGRCWLGWAATAPAFRNRGVQKALLRARLLDARAEGCRLVSADVELPASGAAPPSLRALESCGFRLAYWRTSYLAATLG